MAVNEVPWLVVLLGVSLTSLAAGQTCDPDAARSDCGER